MSDSERAPTNETKIHFGRLTLLWRRAYFAYRRWRRKANPDKYRRQGDPPTEKKPYTKFP